MKSIDDINSDIGRAFSKRKDMTDPLRIVLLESDVRELQSRLQALIYGTKETGPGFYDVRDATLPVQRHTPISGPAHTDAEWFELYGRCELLYQLSRGDKQSELCDVTHRFILAMSPHHKSNLNKALWNDMQWAVNNVWRTGRR